MTISDAVKLKTNDCVYKCDVREYNACKYLFKGWFFRDDDFFLVLETKEGKTHWEREFKKCFKTEKECFSFLMRSACGEIIALRRELNTVNMDIRDLAADAESIKVNIERYKKILKSLERQKK